MIDGVTLRRIEVQPDRRGSFAEVFSDRWHLPIAPRQWSVVHSKAGTMRGMHFHIRHDEFLVPISGRCVVGLYDLRPHSPTLGRSMMIEVDGANPQCITFPHGLVHGWYFPVDSLHLQAVSEPYSEYGDDDNYGCDHTDPELNLAWPGTPSVLSDEAGAFPSLADLRSKVAPLWSR